jgi:hypothetical protein
MRMTRLLAPGAGSNKERLWHLNGGVRLSLSTRASSPLANEQAGDNAGCVFQKPKSGHSVDLQTGLTTHAGVINPDLLAFIKG